MTHEEQHLEQLVASMDAVFAPQRPLTSACTSCSEKYEQGYKDAEMEADYRYRNTVDPDDASEVAEMATAWLRERLWQFGILDGAKVRYDAAERRLVVNEEVWL